jgi:hypothetical protein
MNCIQDFKIYLNLSDYDCSWKLSDTYSEQFECETSFRFNTAEKIGNTLLLPMHWVFTEHTLSNNCVKKCALVVAGIFTAIFALVGIVFKKIGEAINPHTQLRHQAINELKELYNCMVASPAVQKLRQISYVPSPLIIASDFKKELEQSSVADKDKAIQSWNDAADAICLKSQKIEDISEERKILLDLASFSENIQTQLNSWFENHDLRVQIKDLKTPFVQRHNAIIDQLV